MHLYNSLTRTIDPFVPAHNPVRLYVCGVTPYDTTHVGHAFTYVVFDVLIRYLESQGWPVRYVQNVTDIDDDILRRAAQLGISWDQLADEQTDRFVSDLRALNVRMPDVMPRATQEIPMMLEMVQRLLAERLAYERNGSVYFAVDRDPGFGKLSRMDYDEMLVTANERGNYPDDPNKLDPLDFVLWQASKPGEPSWKSPWGQGRPGWHIECSAMSIQHLGRTLDIHGGGADLLFPHHECEIAQSEAYTGDKPFVRFWVHTAMVRFQGEKMSKSLGNMVFVRDLLDNYSPDAIRLHLLNNHYRQSWSFEHHPLEEDEAIAGRLRQAVHISSGARGTPLDISDRAARFRAALDDDLNTPEAIAILSDMASGINNAAGAGMDVRVAQDELRQAATILGLTAGDVPAE